MPKPVAPSEVVAVMRDVLEVTDVAHDDNFFEVGGNSFTALSLITRIKERFGVKLSILDLVRSPTPLEISALLSEAADQP